MADVLFLFIILAFFGLCVLYVHLCEQIIANGEPARASDNAVNRMVD